MKATSGGGRSRESSFGRQAENPLYHNTIYSHCIASKSIVLFTKDHKLESHIKRIGGNYRRREEEQEHRMIQLDRGLGAPRLEHGLQSLALRLDSSSLHDRARSYGVLAERETDLSC